MTPCACGMRPPQQPSSYIAKGSYNAVIRWEIAHAVFLEQHAHCTVVVAA